MDEQLQKGRKQESSGFEKVINSDLLERTEENLDNKTEEKLLKLNLIHPKNNEVPALPKSPLQLSDKDYFDKLFDWITIEEQLREPKQQFKQQEVKDDEECHNLEATQQYCVKLRDKRLCSSETERKRKSKDLLQNRRSTGFLSFEDVENAIKEIEEIGSGIPKNITDSKNDPKSYTGSTEQIKSNLQINTDITDKSVDIGNSDYGPVQLRNKSSSPYNSAASRKRRSRNLLLNRRSTGYVNAEDVEKAKSIEQQQDLDLDD